MKFPFYSRIYLRSVGNFRKYDTMMNSRGGIWRRRPLLAALLARGETKCLQLHRAIL